MLLRTALQYLCIQWLYLYFTMLLVLQTGFILKFGRSVPYYSPTLFRMFPMAIYNKKNCVLTFCVLSFNWKLPKYFKSCYIKFYYSCCKLCGIERHLMSFCYPDTIQQNIFMAQTVSWVSHWSASSCIPIPSQPTVFSCLHSFVYLECYVIDITQVQLFHVGFFNLVYESKTILCHLHIDRSYLLTDKW